MGDWAAQNSKQQQQQRIVGENKNSKFWVLSRTHKISLTLTEIIWLKHISVSHYTHFTI